MISKAYNAASNSSQCKGNPEHHEKYMKQVQVHSDSEQQAKLTRTTSGSSVLGELGKQWFKTAKESRGNMQVKHNHNMNKGLQTNWLQYT